MLKTARLDDPNVLHQVIIRSIRRRKMIMENKDREHFLGKVGFATLMRMPLTVA